ncbi:succinate dehydrogenase cytochrome b subunit [Corynebacterium sp. 153RC1]|uniref:succinate dehydrogenase cytochrome b subunit n=1 Tax=Corynebacterium TaxID=1716 RepID=UPI00211BAB04|nr:MULTISPECIES: succinate dehydrogenase cytochrome b subunit [unclassified Corynebacterium]MCQ9370596.1 succinate dehydrogenase cytochrome b subunit [Corynebacterium sp. 35RC1]MCQ9342698.1 succinate dehydrogenase cytochrome b subunit [Corynebacterium sp. 76QC2CO]MCQ9351749.1 succinate dehydrogenase cytochrome b subunit [Corynebacterium sp. 209RC1]MCQ9354485.1 succinate dehydrogenase cytochrome b subunit [Corynebacterium sp. 1222RC1]MCQ9356031.1 succinate dehydrogenase cytochrome b subunit [Co
MTVNNLDREAVSHGKITEKPLRERPSFPTWALKLTMAITGLIFAGFVVFHMVGNLKIFLPHYEDGTHPIDHYAHWLQQDVLYPLVPHGWFVWIFRAVLLAAIILHVYGAFALTKRSQQSRGKFRRTDLVGGFNSFTTKTMLVTGIVLLAFIIFHILDLTVGVAPAASDVFVHGEVYANMVASFSRWPVTIFYVIAMLVLFLHLSHGIWLATSDLGITGKRWRAVLLFLSYLVPAVVLIGNISIPLAIATGLVG